MSCLAGWCGAQRLERGTHGGRRWLAFWVTGPSGSGKLERVVERFAMRMRNWMPFMALLLAWVDMTALSVCLLLGCQIVHIRSISSLRPDLAYTLTGTVVFG